MSRRIEIAAGQRGVNLLGKIWEAGDQIVLSDSDWTRLSGTSLVGAVFTDLGDTSDPPTPSAGGSGGTGSGLTEEQVNALIAGKQDASTAATDTELAAEASTRSTADSTKQDAATAATDTELAAEATARTSADSTEASARAAADALKQDASTAATDTELAAEATARTSADALKQDAATAATDTELAAESSRAQAAEALLQPAASAATDAEVAAAVNAHSTATPAHTAAGISFSPSGLAIITATQVQAAIAQLDAWANARPTQESGPIANLPANGTRPNESTYFATDDDGGTLWRHVSGVWTPAAPGTTEVGGALVAGPVYLSSAIIASTTGTTQTDVPGMSLAVPTTSRIVRLRFLGQVIVNMGTAASGSVNGLWVLITNNDGSTIYSMVATTFVSTGASIVQNGVAVVEYDIPAGTTGQTYRLRYATAVAVQSGVSTIRLSPGYGVVAGAKNGFTAQVLS